MSLKYILKRVVKLNRSAVPEFVERVKKNSGKSTIGIYFDMLMCALKYGAGYVDYTIFGMFALNSEQRKKVLTRQKNGEYVRVLNPHENWHYFEDKTTFLENNKDLCARDFLDLQKCSKDEFEKFFNSNERFIVKPIDGKCGSGVEIINNAEHNVDTLYNTLIENRQFLVEQLIVQHDKISALFAKSVNTLRIVTMIDNDNNVHIVYACIRLGVGESNVDNFNSGGMTAKIDIDKGIIIGRAINKKGEIFVSHPDSNIKFDGYEIPMWNECKSLAINAAKKNNQLQLVGWDVALTNNGPVLVEANEYPGHDVYQLYGQTDSFDGMLEVFDKIVPYEYIKKQIKINK